MNSIIEYLKRFCMRQGLSQRLLRKSGKRLRASALATCLRGLVAIAFCALFANTAHAQAGPFICDGEIYQVQSGQLRIFDAISSSYVDVGPQNGAYNATGFNIADNFAYGAQGTDVIRIHRDGFIEDVFTAIGFSSFSGDVDDNNTLWLRRATNRYIGIDLATGAQNDITFSGTGISNVADAAFFPDSGIRYLIGYRAGLTTIFNLDTETAVTRNVSGLPAGNFGATWTDFNGRIFTFSNTTGEIFEVFDPLSSAPFAQLVAQGDASGSNDGFSCHRAPFPNLPPLAFDDDYVTSLDTPVVSNVISNSNSSQDDEDPESETLSVSNLPVAGTGPSNGTVSFSANGDFTYTPNAGFFGTDSFDYIVSDPSGLTASATVTILIEHAEITLTKTASPAVDANLGDVITYSYTVTNAGNTDVSNINVTDIHSGPGALSAITPSNVSLSEGETQVFTATYTVTQDDILSGAPITNTATAQGSPARGTIIEPTADASVSLTAPTPEATFSKLASPDADLDAGDTVTYTYTVENTGNVTLNNLSISDNHGGTGTLSAITPATASLAPGATQIFTSTYVITQADFDAGTDVANTATATFSPEQGTLADLTADETVSLNAFAPVSTLTKTASKTNNVQVGDVITYTYVFTNTGNTTMNDVSISDVHSGTGPLGAISPALVASVAPGDDVTFTADYTVTQADVDLGAPITNTATSDASTAGGFAPVAADASVDPEMAAPAAQMVKTASQTSDVQVGDVITYTYAVTNTGNVSIANVAISDNHTSAAGTVALPVSNEMADAGNAAGSIDAAANTGVWDLLAPGDTVSFTSSYIVTEADALSGNAVTNIATATGETTAGMLTDPIANESVTVAPPKADLAITKTNTPGVNSEKDQADDTLIFGATTTYTLTVLNNGPAGITGAVVRDTVGTGLSCAGTNPVIMSGDGLPTGSFTIADLTGAGITLGRLEDTQFTVLAYSCTVN